MPSIGVKLYSVFFKLLLRHRMLNTGVSNTKDGYGTISRANATGIPANASFVDGVATKDINIDPFTSLSLRIFLPQSVLPRDQIRQLTAADVLGFVRGHETQMEKEWENAYRKGQNLKSLSGEWKGDLTQSTVYQGYLPAKSVRNHKKLPIIVQFHGGGFVIGSKDSASNDMFCRRMAKLCNAIVIAVGYRLAPEHKYPAAFEDGFEALTWLAKQANLAQCNKSLEHVPSGYLHKGSEMYRELVDSFGENAVEPWLAAHADPSRCVLLGVSNGSNIADHICRRLVKAGSVLEPLKVVAQTLMYPFFLGKVPTHSEIKLANSYFFDKSSCLLAWKLFLPDECPDEDHPAANPLIIDPEFPLKRMPPTLTVVAELDWMKDRAVAYSEALRKAHVEAPVLEYKDAVHEFATLDILVNTRQAEACSEEIAVWIKKYTSGKDTEFSY
ncbi:protein MpGID1L1 [Marchantia polymorpha subsp. ruderalis]